MRTKKKLVGHFRELPHGLPAGSSLRSSVRDAPSPDAPRIVCYLRNGTMICATMGPGTDVLSPAGPRIDPPHLLTDGVWYWPLDLAYYVERYHVALPAPFVAHMQACGWRPPAVPETERATPSPEECELF